MRFKTVKFKRDFSPTDLNRIGNDGWCLYDIEYDSRKGEWTTHFKRSSGKYRITYLAKIAENIDDHEKERMAEEEGWIFAAKDPLRRLAGYMHYFYKAVGA